MTRSEQTQETTILKIKEILGISPAVNPPRDRSLIEEFGPAGAAYFQKKYRRLARLGIAHRFELD
jgi:hypothetical protein